MTAPTTPDVLPRPSVRTRVTRGLWLAVALVSVALVVVSLLPGEHAGTPVRVVTVVLFAVVAVVTASLVVRPAGLVVDAAGFTVTAFPTRTRYLFADCGAFSTHVAPGSLRKRVVVFDHRLDGAPLSVASKVNRFLTDGKAVVPSTYGLPADELAALLEKRRAAAVRR